MNLGCKLGVRKVNILIYNKTLDLMLVFPRALDTKFNQTLDKYIRNYKDRYFVKGTVSKGQLLFLPN